MPIFHGEAWMQSFSGNAVTPLFLKPDQVSFTDIPHALAQKVRFNGHLQQLGYSVAQHCCMGAEAIEKPFRLAFVVHELSEVYLPDIPAPIKPFLKVMVNQEFWSWTQLEDWHLKTMLMALGLSSIYPVVESREVKTMDLRMLMTEKRDLMGPEPKEWSTSHYEPLPFRIGRVWGMQEAKERFTALYNDLRADV